MQDRGVDFPEALLERITDTPPGTGDTGPRRVMRNGSLRIAVIAAAALVAIAVPTLALADHYGILGLSNPGEPISRASIDPYALEALESYGGDEMRLLGQRAGIAFYVGRHERGGLCFATGSVARSVPKLNGSIGCQNPSADAFPSPTNPILGLASSFRSPPAYESPSGHRVTYITRLGGFAADGVASVGYIDTNGVTHTTPVVDNIYGRIVSEEGVEAIAIVALDAEGREIHRQPLGPTSTPGG